MMTLMRPDPRPIALQSDPLPLGSRYQAAWGEHATRVAQRQSVIQMYLAVAGVIYGFWLASDKTQTFKFFTGPITVITFFTSLLIWMHNRVMQQLTDFMKRCEQSAGLSIELQACGQIHLFYFCDKDKINPDVFHKRQRLLHRCVLALILGATNAAAICYSWANIDDLAKVAASVTCALSIFITIWEFWL
jgi:hypothetical protein